MSLRNKRYLLADAKNFEKFPVGERLDSEEREAMPSPIDPEELHSLIVNHSRALTLLARQWTETPEDCVQEAFVELARQVDCPNNPQAWLFRVVRNRAISMARASIRRKNHEATAASFHSFEDNSDVPFDIDTLNEAIDGLEANLREIVGAKIWDQLSFQQIAEMCGVSTSIAQRKYVTALQQLRHLLVKSITNPNNPT